MDWYGVSSNSEKFCYVWFAGSELRDGIIVSKFAVGSGDGGGMGGVRRSGDSLGAKGSSNEKEEEELETAEEEEKRERGWGSKSRNYCGGAGMGGFGRRDDQVWLVWLVSLHIACGYDASNMWLTAPQIMAQVLVPSCKKHAEMLAYLADRKSKPIATTLIQSR